MKLNLYIAGLTGLLAAPSVFAGFDGTITMSQDPSAPNGGGIFYATTSGLGDFQTFCISINTVFYTGQQYYYNLSSTVDANPPPASPDYITAGTAWVYNQFRNNPSSIYAGTANEASTQATIWYLQGLLTDGHGNYGTAGGFIDPENSADLSSLINLSALETASGMTLAELTANGNGLDGVVAMNLYTEPNGTPIAQPQLAQVPETTTVVAGLLLLLPLGASTLRIFRQNRLA